MICIIQLCLVTAQPTPPNNRHSLCPSIAVLPVWLNYGRSIDS
jgi:hypothetical protein